MKLIWRLTLLFVACRALIGGALQWVGSPALGRFLYETNRSVELRAAKLEERSVVVDGLRWNYYVRDNTEQNDCIVLIHGITAAADQWLRFARYLPANCCLIIPDMPGYGRSEYRADIGYTIPDHAERLKKFLDVVAPQSRFHLVGSSGGGHVATTFALNYPDQAKSLSLMNGTGIAITHKSEADAYEERTGRMVDDMRTREDFDAALKIFSVKTPWMPLSIRNYLADERIARNSYYLEILNTVRKPEHFVDERLKELRLPTLIVWGANDGLVNATMADDFERKISGARKVIFPATGHVPFLEHPVEAADAYITFLNGGA